MNAECLKSVKALAADARKRPGIPIPIPADIAAERRAAQHTPGPRLSGAQTIVLKDMQAKGVVWLRGCYTRTIYALQRKGLIRFNDACGQYEVTETGVSALGPKRWAVDVFESRDGIYGRRHVATQLFFTEWEARNYARANHCEIQEDRNWAEVREATPGEKEFA